MPENSDIGGKIRQIRESQEITIEDLAQRSHASAEMIQRIEHGELVPSLAPLLAIARGLGVRLGTFLDDAPQNGPVVVRSGHREKVVRFSGKVSDRQKPTLDFFSLASGKKDRHMEPFVIEVHPPESDENPLSSHEGEEFIFVMSGQIEICYGKEKYLLKAGDSIYYDSIVPHHVHASGGEDARILAVVYAPF